MDYTEMEFSMRGSKFRYEMLHASIYLEVMKVLNLVNDDPDNQHIAENITKRVMGIVVEETQS